MSIIQKIVATLNASQRDQLLYSLQGHIEDPCKSSEIEEYKKIVEDIKAEYGKISEKYKAMEERNKELAD